MDDFRVGYPNLAAFQSSSDCFSLYRRFAYLQSRLLLEKQDVLRVLECKLDEYDRQNISNSVTRTLLADELATRGELLEQIEKAFNSYGQTK